MDGNLKEDPECISTIRYPLWPEQGALSGLFAGLENDGGGKENAFIEQEISTRYSRKEII